MTSRTAEQFCTRLLQYCQSFSSSDSVYFQCSSKRLPLQMPNDLKDSVLNWFSMNHPNFVKTNRTSWAPPVPITNTSMHFTIVGIDIGYHCFSSGVQHYHHTSPCCELYNPHLRTSVLLTQIYKQKLWTMIVKMNDVSQFGSPTYFIGNSFLQFLRELGRFSHSIIYMGASTQVFFFFITCIHFSFFFCYCCV